MDLLKMEKEYKKFNKEARKLQEELMLTLRKLFIDLPFQMQEIEIEVPKNWIAEQDGFHRIYYPVLDVPEGFCKKDEQYERYGANSFNHKYILNDQKGTKVEINGLASYSNTIFSNEKGKIGFKYFVTYEKIEYTVKISDTEYQLVRNFEYEEMLPKIFNQEIPPAKYDKSAYRMYYLDENKRYKGFLASLGITGEVMSLEEILKSGHKEIELNSKTIAKVKTERVDSVRVDKLYDTIWDVYMHIPFIKNNVCVTIYAKDGQLIGEKNFYWYELIDKMYEEGLTFREVIEILKE